MIAFSWIVVDRFFPIYSLQVLAVVLYLQQTEEPVFRFEAQHAVYMCCSVPPDWKNMSLRQT